MSIQPINSTATSQAHMTLSAQIPESALSPVYRDEFLSPAAHEKGCITRLWEALINCLHSLFCYFCRSSSPSDAEPAPSPTLPLSVEGARAAISRVSPEVRVRSIQWALRDEISHYRNHGFRDSEYSRIPIMRFYMESLSPEQLMAGLDETMCRAELHSACQWGAIEPLLLILNSLPESLRKEYLNTHSGTSLVICLASGHHAEKYKEILNLIPEAERFDYLTHALIPAFHSIDEQTTLSPLMDFLKVGLESLPKPERLPLLQLPLNGTPLWSHCKNQNFRSLLKTMTLTLEQSENWQLISSSDPDFLSRIDGLESNFEDLFNLFSGVGYVQSFELISKLAMLPHHPFTDWYKARGLIDAVFKREFLDQDMSRVAQLFCELPPSTASSPEDRIQEGSMRTSWLSIIEAGFDLMDQEQQNDFIIRLGRHFPDLLANLIGGRFQSFAEKLVKAMPGIYRYNQLTVSGFSGKPFWLQPMTAHNFASKAFGMLLSSLSEADRVRLFETKVPLFPENVALFGQIAEHILQFLPQEIKYDTVVKYGRELLKACPDSQKVRLIVDTLYLLPKANLFTYFTQGNPPPFHTLCTADATTGPLAAEAIKKSFEKFNRDEIAICLQVRAEDGSTPLHHASGCVLSEILNHCSTEEDYDLFLQKDNRGMTALQCIIEKGDSSASHKILRSSSLGKT